MALTPGTHLGPYAVTAPLGLGGMGGHRRPAADHQAPDAILHGTPHGRHHRRRRHQIRRAPAGTRDRGAQGQAGCQRIEICKFF